MFILGTLCFIWYFLKGSFACCPQGKPAAKESCYQAANQIPKVDGISIPMRTRATFLCVLAWNL